MSSIAVDKFGVVGKVVLNGKRCSSANNGSYPSTRIPPLRFTPFKFCSNIPQGVFCTHKHATQQLVTSLCHNLYFAESLGREKYRFLKQHYKQTIPGPLQSHLSVYSFYTIYAASHLFKFRQEEITRVHDVFVLSLISSYMFLFNLSNVKVHFIQCLLKFVLSY